MTAGDEHEPVPRVKICGITTAADVTVATTAGADAVGVISEVPVDTPREVDPDTATQLLAAVPPFTTGVLVTMAETADTVLELAERVDPDVVQLHGGLPQPELERVAAAYTTVAAHSVEATDQLRTAAEVVDGLLLDTVDADGGGGTGRTHDWSLARSRIASLDVPVILAGGLAPGNVAAAVDTVAPYGVDVASGVASEDDPARKDPAAVREFVANARSGREVDAPWSR